MMVPGCTTPPSYTFTPRRLETESRPFRVEPPPLVFDMSRSCAGGPGDPGDLDGRVLLAVSPPLALVRLVLVGEATDLGALDVAHDARLDRRAGEIAGLGHDPLAVDEQNRRERHLVLALGSAQALDL